MVDNKIGYGKRIVVSAADTPIGGAMLEIDEGKQTDMIFHMNTDKILYVLQGLLKVRVLKDGQITTLNVKPGVSFYIRAGVVHQLEALEISVVLEFVSDTALYKENDGDEDTNVVSLGTKPEVIPEVVKEGEFATMTPEDEANAKPKRPSRPINRKVTSSKKKKKKPASKKKRTTKKRK